MELQGPDPAGHHPPAAQSPAQPCAGQRQGRSSRATVPPAAPALRSWHWHTLFPHPLWQLSCAAATLAGQHVPDTAWSTERPEAAQRGSSSYL